jgi:ribonuclease P protein component
MKPNSFKKEERLCNKRLIERLYSNGSSFHLYPFRVTFLLSKEILVPAQVLIAVPKRRFKRAVDRNLLKRRIREGYRINKQLLLYEFLDQQQAKVLFSIQYIGKEIHDYRFIELKLRETLLKLQNEYTKLHLGTDH